MDIWPSLYPPSWKKFRIGTQDMDLNAETDVRVIEECYLYIPQLSALECSHPLWTGASYIISVLRKIPPHLAMSQTDRGLFSAVVCSSHMTPACVEVTKTSSNNKTKLNSTSLPSLWNSRWCFCLWLPSFYRIVALTDVCHLIWLNFCRPKTKTQVVRLGYLGFYHLSHLLRLFIYFFEVWLFLSFSKPQEA